MSTEKFSGFVLELKTFNDFMNNPDESVSSILNIDNMLHHTFFWDARYDAIEDIVIAHEVTLKSKFYILIN